jgi:4-amino-4-deoxy-L-arabinose transferase-like glycosyltransferase
LPERPRERRRRGSMSTNRRLSLPLLVAAAAMLLGAGLRLHNIRDRSMEHIEMYVPNIPMGTDLSVPKTRADLSTVVTNTLSSDAQPLGYYVFMWFVTKCFGTGTLAIRLPSVLFGVASIGLVYWLGVLIGQRIAGCVAAAFLAFNGYQIVWSETGRMYAMVTFLGLLSTILLLLLARSDRRRRGLEIGYAAVTLMGLFTHVFFWALLAVQMVWVLGNAWAQKRSMPRLLNVQILVVILGSPLLAFAVYQSANQVTFTSSVPVSVREYLQFEYLIPSWDDTSAPVGRLASEPNEQFQRDALKQRFFLPQLLLLPVCVLLLIAGLWWLKPTGERLLDEQGGSYGAAWLAAAVLGVMIILAHVAIAGHHVAPRPTLKYTKAMTPLPLLLVLGAALLRKSWDRLRNLSSHLSLHFLQGGPPLIWMLALGPLALLAIASFAYRPLTDPRRLLFLSPYLLLVLAIGAVRLGQRSRWLALALFLVLGAFHGLSVAAYRDRIAGPLDFKGFADKLIPRLNGDDLIFLRREFDTTPILYYVRPGQYHILASHFAEACSRNPNARVWALLLHGEPLTPEMKPALAAYQAVETVDFYGMRGVLYCRGPCQ